MIRTLWMTLIFSITAIIIVNPSLLMAEESEDRERREHLQNRIDELQEELRHAMRSGQQEEIRELMETHRRLIRERAELQRNSHHEAEDAAHDRRELAKRLGELARESHELRREGKHDDAEQVMREMRELSQQLHQRPQRKERQISEEEKIDRLHQAAENLEAGGFHEEARELHQRAEHLQEELERHLQEKHDHEHHGDHDMQRQHELIKRMQEMHKMMQQMQHQLRQMQEQLDHVRRELSAQRKQAQPIYPPLQYTLPPSANPNEAPETVRPSPPPTKLLEPHREFKSPSEGEKKELQPNLSRPLKRDKPELKERKKPRESKRDNTRETKEETNEGSAKEVVLSMNSMKFMLDLDTGKTIDPPATQRAEFVNMDIVPLQYQPDQQPEVLICNNLLGFKGKPGDWQMEANELQKQLNLYPLSRLSKLNFDDSQTATYLYRTKEGTEGILQLVELVDSPKGIRVRYRSLN